MKPSKNHSFFGPEAQKWNKRDHLFHQFGSKGDRHFCYFSPLGLQMSPKCPQVVPKCHFGISTYDFLCILPSLCSGNCWKMHSIPCVLTSKGHLKHWRMPYQEIKCFSRLGGIPLSYILYIYIYIYICWTCLLKNGSWYFGKWSEMGRRGSVRAETRGKWSHEVKEHFLTRILAKIYQKLPINCPGGQYVNLTNSITWS